MYDDAFHGHKIPSPYKFRLMRQSTSLAADMLSSLKYLEDDDRCIVFVFEEVLNAIKWQMFVLSDGVIFMVLRIRSHGFMKVEHRSKGC